MHSVAILLAAGDSERMGSPKALLEWHGRPLLTHQLERIQASAIAECVVVLGREAARLAPLVQPPDRPGWKTRPVFNPRHADGRSASIRAGLLALPAAPEAVLIAGVDQPLGEGLIDALLAAAKGEGWGSGAARRTIVVPVCGGRRGHPPLFSGSLFRELLEVREESAGLKAVIRRSSARVLEMPWNDEDVLLNLNTPLDAAPIRSAGPSRPGS